MTHTRPDRLLRGVLNAVALAALLAAAFTVWPRTLGGRVSYVKVSGTSMLPTVRDGDLVAVRSQSAYRAGEVIAYRIPHGDIGAGLVVIHRIIGGSPTTGYRTKGDHRTEADLWHPRPADVVGRQWFTIPGAGNAMGRFRDPVAFAAFVAIVAGTAAYELTKPRRPTPLARSGAESDEPTDPPLTTDRAPLVGRPGHAAPDQPQDVMVPCRAEVPSSR